VESEIDGQQARDDEHVLLDARWRTQARKQILSRVAQLGQVVLARRLADDRRRALAYEAYVDD
jgi:hypothetical protein